MTTRRLMKIAARTTALGALLVGFASLAMAQQSKPPAGPPITTKGAAQSSPKADKGQAKAEEKRTEARERKDVKNADKLENTEQRTALKAARGEPKALLKGIKLTKDQRKTIKASEKQYASELRAIEKQARISEKAGQADPSVVARVEELRRRERAQVRAALTPQEQIRFDANLAAFGSKKP